MTCSDQHYIAHSLKGEGEHTGDKEVSQVNPYHLSSYLTELAASHPIAPLPLSSPGCDGGMISLDVIEP